MTQASGRDGAKEREAGRDAGKDGSWNKSQLQALLSSLNTFGYGRPDLPSLAATRYVSLGALSAESVLATADYVVQLATALLYAEDDEEDAELDDEVHAARLEQEAAAFSGRLWHFLRCGVAPAAADSLVPPPPVTPLRTEMASWLASRLSSRSKAFIAQLIDLRRQSSR